MLQVLRVLSIFCFLTSSVMAQDERYYRHLLTGQIPRSGQEFVEHSQSQFNVTGPFYKIDLNGDGVEELVQPQKRDGVDWIEIRSSSGNKFFEAKLLAIGAESSVYKIRLVHLSNNVKTLIVFLDEGFTRGRRFESTARVFFISYESNNLSNMSITQGPHFFHEKQAPRDQYWRRDYSLNVLDLNNDGVRDISFSYNHIQHLFVYKRGGEWERL